MADFWKCDICDVNLRNSSKSKHLNSIKHKNNSTIRNERITNTPAKNTIKSRENSENHLRELFKKNPKATVEDAYEHLKAKNLMNSTIEKILRVGYLKTQFTRLNKKQMQDAEVFIKNLKDKITIEQNDKEPQELPDIEQIRNNGEIPNIIKLYTFIPLRIDTFAKMKIVSNTTDKLQDDEITHLDLTTSKIYIYNHKTVKFDSFEIKQDTIDFIKNNPFKPTTTRTLTRRFAEHDLTTQSIRKAYAMYQKDLTYGARILGHSVVTHKGYYQQNLF
jgi:hypothetical protein